MKRNIFNEKELLTFNFKKVILEAMELKSLPHLM
jgi:hypothetical protein